MKYNFKDKSMTKYLLLGTLFISSIIPSFASSPKTGETSKNSKIEKRVQNIRVETDTPTAYAWKQKKLNKDSGGSNDKIFVCGIEQQADFPGGMRALMEWVKSNKRYPEECVKEGIQGRVIVKFTIEKDGSVSNVKVVKGIHPLLDAEAVRLVESMPKWEPGKNEGEPIASQMNIPISFKRPVEER